MWNGAWFDPFVPNGAIHAFPPTPDLSVQWASTDKRICTLAPDLECSESHVEQTLPQRGGPAPQLGATELRPTSGDVAGKCIRCDFPRVLINDHFAGRATVKLTILARPDGTVSSVEVVNTPDSEVGAALSKAATKWMFYPVLRNGVPVPTKRTLDLSVAVIKTR